MRLHALCQHVALPIGRELVLSHVDYIVLARALCERPGAMRAARSHRLATLQVEESQVTTDRFLVGWCACVPVRSCGLVLNAAAPKVALRSCKAA